MSESLIYFQILLDYSLIWLVFLAFFILITSGKGNTLQRIEFDFELENEKNRKECTIMIMWNVLFSLIVYWQNSFNFITENIQALALLGLFLSLFIIIIGAFINLFFSLQERRKLDGIPKGKMGLTIGYFVIFLGISFFTLSISDDLNSIGSWASACFFALFIVVLQDFQGYKTVKEIESIHKILKGESEGFIKQAFEDQQGKNTKRLEEITFLKNELIKAELENEHLRKVYSTLKRKKSLITILENYLTKSES